ncbi:uncharacterized protein LOC121750569 isoform X2 [Salvia splendens]|uniref:uncharacterized protein LOC121750569 isoform X2 n=1 Tax=Salvia splendens TaxID=180675 RepID=UPI001C2767EB|nr:uncharacterized protein LOC121750569 isoform X2 [Salvia splendens]
MIQFKTKLDMSMVANSKEIVVILGLKAAGLSDHAPYMPETPIMSLLNFTQWILLLIGLIRSLLSFYNFECQESRCQIRPFQTCK